MVQTKKVLWISRHALSDEQQMDLERARCSRPEESGCPPAGGGLRRGEGRNRSSLSSTGAGSRSWTSRSRLGPCDPASQKEPPVP